MQFAKFFCCLFLILNVYQIALVNGQSRTVYCRNYENDINFQGNDLDSARFYVKSKEGKIIKSVRINNAMFIFEMIYLILRMLVFVLSSSAMYWLHI